MMDRFILAVSLAIAAGACVAPRMAPSNARVDQIFATWDRMDSPGCGIGASRGGDVMYERGYGMASLERKVPITTSTVFHLASITKPFTAMSVLLAAERGQLSLDDDVSKYVPDWSVRQHRVTIRHLLTHTSGLRDAYILQGWAPDNGDSNDARITLLARQRGLNSVPGAEYQYNNGGYLLLGRIVERATEQTLGAFADAHIFRPLEMKDAYFNGDPVRTAPEHASGYSPQASGWRLVPESSGYAGNGGMMSSVRDLLAWADNFADPRVGTSALLTQMQAATVLTGGHETPHGMGFAVGSYRGLRTLRASGGDYGMATQLAIYPSQRLAIAVLCNQDSVAMGGLATVNVDDLTNRVADVLFDDVLASRETPGASAPQSGDASPPTPVHLSEEALRRKTGLFRLGSDENHIVSLSVRDGKLTAWDFWGDNYPMLLTPISENRFTLPGLALEFSPATAGRPQAWHLLGAGEQRLMELSLVRADVPVSALPSFAGQYRSEELNVTYAVAVGGRRLRLQSSMLHPVSNDVFAGDYVGLVRFFRDAQGNISGFTLNRNAARGVRFERVREGAG